MITLKYHSNHLFSYMKWLDDQNTLYTWERYATFEKNPTVILPDPPVTCYVPFKQLQHSHVPSQTRNLPCLTEDLG